MLSSQAQDMSLQIITCYFINLKKSVTGHAPRWSSSLFVFEDFNGDIGKFRPWNREHCKSSEFML